MGYLGKITSWWQRQLLVLTTRLYCLLRRCRGLWVGGDREEVQHLFGTF